MSQNSNNSMEVPDEQEDWILQGKIQFGDNFIRTSDCLDGFDDQESEKVSLAVECTVEEVKKCF